MRPSKKRTRLQLSGEFNQAADDDLLREDVVAGYLNVTVSKLQRDRFLKRGIPFVKNGYIVRYKKRDVVKSFK